MKKWIAIPALTGLLVLGGVGLIVNADKNSASSEESLLVEEVEREFGRVMDYQVTELAHEKVDDYEPVNGVVQAYNNELSSLDIISEEQAIAIAQELGQGIVTEVELDTDDGWAHYDIEMKDQPYEYEFEIDAVTGEVVEFEKDRDDD